MRWGATAARAGDGVERIERMRPVTELPLTAMPNAGMPRAVEGRNIYLTSPEYMASFARKLVKAGASIVGGCCGTTPSHIRAMKSGAARDGSAGAAHQVVARAGPACREGREGRACSAG